MNSSLLNFMAAVATGALVSIVAAAFSFHARFIRMEVAVKALHGEIKLLRKAVMNRLPRITISDGWTDGEKEDDDPKW